jgi:hypothetical protein
VDCGTLAAFQQIDIHSRIGIDMKTSTADEFSSSSTSVISFRSLDADDLHALLQPFYLGLDFDGRRARFGCAVSDDSIIRHCRGLDPDQAVVLGCTGPNGLIAAIELHPLLSTWEDAELALADAAVTDRIMILGHLLQLAAFAAGKRGCNTLIVTLGPSERELLRLLRGMGRVRVQGDSARVDLGEYARLHGLSTGQP